jgi:hypothetical protein
MSDQASRDRGAMQRRDFLTLGAGLAAAAVLSTSPVGAQGVPHARPGTERPAPRPGRRMLGSLEVSSVGLGVQNMARKYETTVPYRPAMVDVIRGAFDRGGHLLRHRRGLRSA